MSVVDSVVATIQSIPEWRKVPRKTLVQKIWARHPDLSRRDVEQVLEQALTKAEAGGQLHKQVLHD